MPIWLRVVLVVTGAGAGWLVGRLVWEQTVLSWRSGPQMIGFTLMHAELGLFFALLGSSLLFAVALVLAIGMSVAALVRRRRVSPVRWVAIAVGVGILGLGFVPYGVWQRVFAAKIAKGPYAAEFFTYAAATGDLGTVRALMNRGLDVNTRRENGSTALHGAAVEGQVEVLRYLISRGADPLIRNNSGDTALDDAREMKRDAAVSYLGEVSQRQAATSIISVPRPMRAR